MRENAIKTRYMAWNWSVWTASVNESEHEDTKLRTEGARTCGNLRVKHGLAVCRGVALNLCVLGFRRREIDTKD